jgi:transcriptional regulator with XRE-family HTH domain
MSTLLRNAAFKIAHYARKITEIMSFLSEYFSKRLSEIREARGLQKNEASDLIGTDPANISRWEGGKYIPSEEQLKKIEAAYDLNAQNFVGDVVERAHLVVSITSRLSALDQVQLRQIDRAVDLFTRATPFSSSGAK